MSRKYEKSADNGYHTPLNEISDESRYLGYSNRLARLTSIVRRVRLAQRAARVGRIWERMSKALGPILGDRVQRISYAVVLGYVGVDTTLQGWIQWEHSHNAQQVSNRIGRTLFFHGFATLLFPAVIINTQVRYAARLFKYATPNAAAVNKYGPSAVGLCTIPLLPYVVDRPMNYIATATFDETFGELDDIMALYEEEQQAKRAQTA